MNAAHNTEACIYCGESHGVRCPLVKAIEYEHGMVKKVEFFAPNDYAPKFGANPYLMWPHHAGAAPSAS